MASMTDKSGCLPRFLQSFLRNNTAGGEKSGIAPYRLRDDFLSGAELTLFWVLRQVIGEQAILMAKVRMADIFFVPKHYENAGGFNQISQKACGFF